MTDLPLEGHIEYTTSGWSVRLPLRREVVSVSKHTVVAERVDLRRERIESRQRLETSLRRERPRIDTFETGAREEHRSGTLGGTGMEQDPLA